MDINRAIARVVGAPTEGITSVCDWQPDTHPGWWFSEIIYGERVVCWRVENKNTGQVWSKLLDDQLVIGHDYDAEIDAMYAEAMKHQHVKNLHIIPALWKAHPEFDPEKSEHVLPLPKFRVVSGVLHVDGRHLEPAHQATLATILAKHPVVAAPITG